MKNHADPWVETLSLPKSFLLRAGGAADISRWWNHRLISTALPGRRARIAKRKDLGNDKGLKPTAKVIRLLRGWGIGAFPTCIDTNGAGPWHLKIGLPVCSGKRETPRDKPVASHGVWLHLSLKDHKPTVSWDLPYVAPATIE
jgi:hypothetical protein